MADATSTALLPLAARRFVVAALVVFVGGAAYLSWVRGPAILLDLAGSAFRAMCF
jgi:hypothetical protein